MGIPRAEMLASDTCHVQQRHDLPEQHIVEVDALPKSLFFLKNDDDTYRRFIHRVMYNVLRSLQQAQVNMADKAHS